MKKLIFNLTATIIGFAGIAQKNNPYDSFGKDYFESISKIVADIKENGFKGNDQKSLDYYKGLTSLNLRVNPELANEVYAKQKADTIDIAEVINSSPASDQAKEFSFRIIADISQLSANEKMRYYEELTGEVRRSDISEEEKELNLKLISVANYAHQNPDIAAQLSNRGGDGCIAMYPGGPKWVDPTNCVIIGALAGAYVGWYTCGFWCAVGGAVIFGVLTAIFVC